MQIGFYMFFQDRKFRFNVVNIFVFAQLASPLCLAQSVDEVKLSARLASVEIPINREGLLIVEARWVGKPGDITIEAIDSPTLTNLKLVSTATSNQVLRENDALVTLRRYEFYLKGETLGMAYIDDVRLRYRDANGDENTLRTARLQLKITDPVSEPMKNYILPITAAGVALLVVAAAGVLLLNERRKKRAREADEASVKISMEEQYRDKLQKTVDLHASDLAEQYNKLAILLRSYLNESLAPESTGRTTQELVEQLHEMQVEMNKVASIQEILQACDLVKFSGGSADPNQITRLYTLFEDLLREPQAVSGQLSNASTNQIAEG